MGADYNISCKCCNENLSDFYITRNYNLMFPFWMLHNHINSQDDYDFMVKTVRNELRYFVKGSIYNHLYWEDKMHTRPEHYSGQPSKGWEVNKYTVVMALIRYYWHLKRYPFNKYKWSCWY